MPKDTVFTPILPQFGNLDYLGFIKSYQVSQLPDIQGRLIRTAKINGTMIDVSNLNNGLYILSLINEDTLVSKRFVKE